MFSEVTQLISKTMKNLIKRVGVITSYIHWTILVLFLIISCSSDDNAFDPNNLTGEWKRVSGEVVSLSLIDSLGKITGRGRLEGIVTLDIQGVFAKAPRKSQLSENAHIYLNFVASDCGDPCIDILADFAGNISSDGKFIDGFSRCLHLPCNSRSGSVVSSRLMRQ